MPNAHDMLPSFATVIQYKFKCYACLQQKLIFCSLYVHCPALSLIGFTTQGSSHSMNFISVLDAKLKELYVLQNVVQSVLQNVL